jgi:hypothetical protein
LARTPLGCSPGPETPLMESATPLSRPVVMNPVMPVKLPPSLIAVVSKSVPVSLNRSYPPFFA